MKNLLAWLGLKPRPANGHATNPRATLPGVPDVDPALAHFRRDDSGRRLCACGNVAKGGRAQCGPCSRGERFVRFGGGEPNF